MANNVLTLQRLRLAMVRNQEQSRRSGVAHDEDKALETAFRVGVTFR